MASRNPGRDGKSVHPSAPPLARGESSCRAAYDEAARELFGEHARLNFPDGIDAWLEAEASRADRAEAA